MEVLINGHSHTLKDVIDVAIRGARVGLAGEARSAMQEARDYVCGLICREQPVYGITTGFGKFSDVFISGDAVAELQENLITSHACGVGPELPVPETRAMMLLRANALALGHSGVRPHLVEMILACLNANALPVVPSKGSLGASGDLVPLAHMGLFLIGQGEARVNGRLVSAQEALAYADLEPVKLEAKEGLALVNGTQFMSARGCLALQRAQELALAADGIAAITCQVLRGIPAAYSPLIHQVRPHPGQLKSAENLRRFLAGSNLTSEPGELRTQDAYALRCIPQVHGASHDVISYVTQLFEREINSATDNPLVFARENQVISGGNFHGQPLAMALDYLAIAVAELASLSERRIERMVNPQLNDLPPFLTERGGLNSGMMIPQYVAAALVSENKVLCHPASVDSIPSSGNQEDHVSMGAIAANKLAQVIENLYSVLAIELLCACQAADFRGSQGLSPVTRQIYDLVRFHVRPMERDRSVHHDIKVLTEMLEQGKITSMLQERQ